MPGFLDPNDPTSGGAPALRGGIPGPATAEQPAAPPPGHPGFFSRIGNALMRGSAHLTPFQIDPTYAGMFDENQQNYLKSEAQRQFATGLLRAGGPAPAGTQNFGSRLGEAMGSVDMDQLQQGMAGRVWQMWQQELFRDQYRRMQDAFQSEQHPGEGATMQEIGDYVGRIYPKLIQIGGPALDAAKGLEPFLQLTHPELNPANYDMKEGPDPRSGSPTYGKMVQIPTNKVTGQPSPVWMAQGGGGVQTGTNAPASQQQFSNQNDFLSKYNGEVGDYRDRLEQLRGASALYSQSRQKLLTGDGPTQYAFMRQFINGLRMKGARPGEADANMLDEASSTIAQWQRKLQGYLGQNKLMTPAEVNEIGDVLKRIDANVTGSWNNVNKQYTTLAEGNRATVGNAERLLQKPEDVQPARLTNTVQPPDMSALGATLRAARARRAKRLGQ